MKKIKLAVADDQFLFRKGLIALLAEHEEFRVLIDAENGKDLLDQMEKKKPDIVLLDLEMPVMDGIEVTSHIKHHYPDVRVIVLTMHNSEEYIVHLIEKGARGFLLKNTDVEVLVDAIYSVKETGYYFNDLISKAMVTGLARKKRIKPDFRPVKLTEREIEIVRLICKELSNREMAEKLFISLRTIEGHRERILEKTGARNAAGIVLFAVKNNLLEDELL